MICRWSKAVQNVAKFYTTNSFQKKADSVTFDMDVCFISDGSIRDEITQFIQSGYKKAFNADISITMPALLYIEDKSLKAALGLRGHCEEFFIQQYLDKPIIKLIQEKSPSTLLEHVVEVGSLYSNSTRFIIPLFMVTAVTSYLLGKKFLVLSGTAHVINLLSKSGVAYQEITRAEKDKLRPSSDSWGAYYDSNPQVVIVSLYEVMQLIESNKFYKKLLARLSDQIEKACRILEGRL